MSLTMQKTAFALACLVCLSHGRRMQSPHVQLQSSAFKDSQLLEGLDSSRALAMLLMAAPHPASAFNPSSLGSHLNKPILGGLPASVSSFNRLGRPVAEVKEIGSSEEFKEALSAAGESLVVIDYSTSWCGPCKIIAPVFNDLSEEHTDVVFLKVMGDSSDDAMKLLKEQGVRALPAFHFWKNNEQVETISGAKTQPLKDAIVSHK
mmetsp:Transcript_17119/g.30525  ORF Transcript_17119/g.30525 Transcript_17119/m.30525 type:complete len:206 (-) Transcript_17119:96-713(-)